jgi:hypothetical protein
MHLSSEFSLFFFEHQHHYLPSQWKHNFDSNVSAAWDFPRTVHFSACLNYWSPFFRHNKKTCQWDVRANEVTMEYGEHLGPVNTATLIDDDRYVSVYYIA